MIPESKLLSDIEIEEITDKIFLFLEKNGVKVQHWEVLRLLDKAGVDVDHESHVVRFPRPVLEIALKKAPSRFSLANPDGRKHLAIPTQQGGFFTCTNTGASNVIDAVTGAKRLIEIQDVEVWGRLVNILENIDMCAFPTPANVPPETADIHSLKALLENTGKHVCIQPHTEKSLEYLVELAVTMAGGLNNHKKNPITSIFCCSLTPFQFKKFDMEVLLKATKCGMPIHASSLPVAGGTAPLTVAGAVMVATIEVIALVAMTQLIEPGHPVVGLITSLAMDMQTGRVKKAAVDVMRINAASSQLLKRAFHIPTHTCAFTSDFDLLDDRTMLERYISCALVAGAGVDIIGRPGELEAAKTISSLQLIIDDEIVGIIKRALSAIRLDEDEIAWNAILETPHGGNFLDHLHTLAHCRNGFNSWLLTGRNERVEEKLFQQVQAKFEQFIDVAEKDVAEIPERIRMDMDRIVREADEKLSRKKRR
ncbi:MAG: hypothetical protein DRP87_00885 [Spirochaetes bacterium]|nr:MAG: hypothetical protein DRP87_00885 [Spirochaetota bacterium]